MAFFGGWGGEISFNFLITTNCLSFSYLMYRTFLNRLESPFWEAPYYGSGMVLGYFISASIEKLDGRGSNSIKLKF